MKKETVFKMIESALFAALIFIGTQFIKVPMTFGYFNAGDIFVLLSGYIVGGWYAVVASAIGSAMADILSGYAIYAPATLIIKALMSLLVFVFCRRTFRNARMKYLAFSVSAFISELIMVLGYLLFESVLYGFAGALASLPGNLLQGAMAIVVGVIVVSLLDRIKYRKS